MSLKLNDCCRCNRPPVLRRRTDAYNRCRYFYCPKCEFVAKYRFDGQSDDDALIVKDWNRANPSKAAIKRLAKVAKPVCTYCNAEFYICQLDEEEYVWLCKCSNRKMHQLYAIESHTKAMEDGI